MSTKERHNLEIFVNTLKDLVDSTERTKLDTSVYGIQIVARHTEFKNINYYQQGYSQTGNLSDNSNGFVLFSFDEQDPEDTFQYMTYKCVVGLICLI